MRTACVVSPSRLRLHRLFVALVVMALVTSLIAGPLMQLVLHRKQPARFLSCLSGKTFISGLALPGRKAVIDALAAAAEPVANIHRDLLAGRVWAREQTMSTALPGGLGVPHARVPRLDKPLVAIGNLPAGVDWNAPDGQPVRLVLLVLTPVDAHEVQIELLADIATTFQQRAFIEKAVACDSYVQFLAMLKTERESPDASPHAKVAT